MGGKMPRVSGGSGRIFVGQVYYNKYTYMQVKLCGGGEALQAKYSYFSFPNHSTNIATIPQYLWSRARVAVSHAQTNTRERNYTLRLAQRKSACARAGKVRAKMQDSPPHRRTAVVPCTSVS